MSESRVYRIAFTYTPDSPCAGCRRNASGEAVGITYVRAVDVDTAGDSVAAAVNVQSVDGITVAARSEFEGQPVTTV